MWQRKQTLFLACSIVAIAICLFEPVGVAYTTTGLGEGHLLMNLGLQNAGNIDVMPVWPLFALATIAGVLSTVGIFLFRNRKMQMRTCSGAMASNLLWYVYYVILFIQSDLEMHIQFAACLPLVSCIFLWLAKKGIKADDDLVKSMDRIR